MAKARSFGIAASMASRLDASTVVISAFDSRFLRAVASVLLSTAARCEGFRLSPSLLERNGGVSVMSRAGRRREYAAARVVGPAANPKLPVRARRRLLKRHKLGAPHDPAFRGHGYLVSRLAVIVAATPLADRISIAAAIDPRIMSMRLRRLGDHPNERDPE